MATVYKIQVTSWSGNGKEICDILKKNGITHWISYSEESLKNILEEAVKKIEREKGNTIQFNVIERQKIDIEPLLGK